MIEINLTKNINDLKAGLLSPKKFKQHQQVTKNLIRKLKVDKELSGHNGRVNCLEWNDTGELLASGSDDSQVIIWDPLNYSLVSNINAFYVGKVCSVKFMPKCNSTKIVAATAAQFKTIDVSQNIVVDNFDSHGFQVKRLAVSSNEPNLIWSGLEDGTIRQFDIRESPHKQNKWESVNILINLSSDIGEKLEVKCLAISPTRSNQIAVGSNDPYVRLYDRRKLSLKSIQKTSKVVPSKMHPSQESNSNSTFSTYLCPPNSDNVVQYFVPGHIPYNYGSDQLLISSTFLTFSPDGNQLLVNMGSEHVYLYDVNKTRPLTTYQTSLAKYVANCDKDLYCNYSSVKPATPVKTKHSSVQDNTDYMQHYLIKLKEQGNEMYNESDFHCAVMTYNTALKSCGNPFPRLYANRAAAFISRDWAGDLYAALLDSLRELHIDYGHIKSHFRIANCLFKLNMVAEAHDYIKYIVHLFPKQSKKIKEMNELRTKIANQIAEILVLKNKESSKRKFPKNPSRAPDKVTDITEFINLKIHTRRYMELVSFSTKECQYRSKSNDYVHRYCGSCNTATDFMEANFFGTDGQFIMAGSDDGNIFFWDRETENLLRVVRGDSRIVNCLQAHPSMCMLASSGYDNVVRLWMPNPPSTKRILSDEDYFCITAHNSQLIGIDQNLLRAVHYNQEQLRVDKEMAMMSFDMINSSNIIVGNIEGANRRRIDMCTSS